MNSGGGNIKLLEVIYLMEKERNNLKSGEPKETDPRVVEGQLYRDPVAVCYRIGDIIYKILANEQNMSDELNKQCLEVLELTGTVRDSCYIKNDSSAHVDNLKLILSLSNALKKLIDNDEFLQNYDSLSFNEAKSEYSWNHDNLPGIKTKEDFAEIMKKYIDLLNYFALESFPTSRKNMQ